jgi:penicillin-binding protein 2
MDKVSADVASRANAWFVGIAPRRNPDIAVVVLVEHGGWGNTSAPLAARVIETFVDKQRRLNNNLLEAKVPSKVEVGAVWSEQPEQEASSARSAPAAVASKGEDQALHGGHFLLPPPPSGDKRKPPTGAATGASQVAAVQH